MNLNLKEIFNQFRSAADTAQRGIAKLRAEIPEKRRAITSATGAPLPIEDVDRRIDALVDGRRAAWLKEQHGALVRAIGNPREREKLPRDWHDTVTWLELCGLFPELVKAQLHAAVRALPYEAGPAEADRARVVAKLERELQELEQTEEAAIDEAAAAGVVIAHRSEVVERRETERLHRERHERAAADRQRREAAINERHEATTRAAARIAGGSSYIHTGKLE